MLYEVVFLALGVIVISLKNVDNKRRGEQVLAHIPTHTFLDGDNSRKHYLSDLKTLLESGYQKYNKNEQAFKITIPVGGYSVKYQVILPKNHLEEIKHLSDNVFSWQLASRVILAQDFTGAPDRTAWSGKALRVGIHQNLEDITSSLIPESADMSPRVFHRKRATQPQ
jgi:ent-kaurene oxidase